MAGNDLEQMKRRAAERAVAFIAPGMVVGLGHGTTARYAIRNIARLMRDGVLNDILGIPCSLAVEQEALALGIPLTTLDEHPAIDLTIDGADEVDPHTLNIIKGGGGALLREKIVAQASRREIIVVDASKLSPQLGQRASVPVEVATFGWGAQVRFLVLLGAKVTPRLRDDGDPFLTDQGNLILDCHFGPISNPAHLAERLQARAGIIEHGLFLHLATDIIITGETGIRHLMPES